MVVWFCSGAPGPAPCAMSSVTVPARMTTTSGMPPPSRTACSIPPVA